MGGNYRGKIEKTEGKEACIQVERTKRERGGGWEMTLCNIDKNKGLYMVET